MQISSFAEGLQPATRLSSLKPASADSFWRCTSQSPPSKILFYSLYHRTACTHVAAHTRARRATNNRYFNPIQVLSALQEPYTQGSHTRFYSVCYKDWPSSPDWSLLILHVHLRLVECFKVSSPGRLPRSHADPQEPKGFRLCKTGRPGEVNLPFYGAVCKDLLLACSPKP